MAKAMTRRCACAVLTGAAVQAAFGAQVAFAAEGQAGPQRFEDALRAIADGRAAGDGLALLAMLPDDYWERVTAFLADPRWADGAPWSGDATPQYSAYGAWGCAAYAADYAAYVLGETLRSGGRYTGGADEIRTGDLVHYYWPANEHWFVVLAREGDVLYTAEGGWGGRVVVSRERYAVSGGELLVDGQRGYTFEEGYHFDIVTNLDQTGFHDVALGRWYTESVLRANAEGLMTGMGSNLFGVGRPLTRAQLAVVLWRIARPADAARYDEVRARTANETGMDDVRGGQWYTGAANWAVAAGVLHGVERREGDGTAVRRFEPDEPVTRETMVTMIANFAQAPASADEAPLRAVDVEGADEISPWARNAFAWALGAGVVNGTARGGKRCLEPRRAIKREEAAAIVCNARDRAVL